MGNTKKLSQVSPNEKIKIIEAELLEKFPRLKDRTLICSVIKWSSSRLFFQYFSPETGSGTLKLLSDPQVEVLGQESTITLSQLLADNKHKDNRPKTIILNCNGRLERFVLTPEFWDQNPKNIKLRHLVQGFQKWSTPGSSIVKEIVE